MIDAAKLSLKKRIALNLYAAKRSMDAVAHDLRYLFWECTLRCNLRCLHCGSDCSHDSAAADLPLGDFLAVLDGIKKKLDPGRIVICITGGEPLMRSDLTRAGEEISRRGFRWGMVTNGMLMTAGRLRELQKAGLASLTISLDGLEADHSWFRGNSSSFKKAVKAIGLAAATVQNKSLSDFDVITCANQRNFTSLDTLKQKLVGLGVRKWRIVSVFPKGRAAANMELLLTPEQMRKLMEFIRKTRKEGTIAASYGCEGFLGSYEMEVRDSPFFCRAGISIGSVLIDGSVSACPSLRADYIQGNIHTDDFLDIWNNRFSVMRNRAWARTGECLTCKVWRHCHGSGLHLRDEKSGNLLFCNYKALTMTAAASGKSHA
jgi:radical SAM enzyme (rSAM/lipoprotein system)